jgi:DNA processing protein
LQPSKDPMSAETSPDWQDWYRLSFNYGLSFAQKLALLKHFSLPENIFAASSRDIAEVVGELAASGMQARMPELDEGLADCLLWLNKSSNHHLISLVDTHFPAGLLDLADPPFLLFAKGNLSALTLPLLAMVGSRSASPQGLENAKAFARAMGKAGYGVVSGLALGIDTAAHEGALEAAAPTIAVVGTGIDRVYPARNHRLAQEIAAKGLILSEFVLGSPPLQHHFPKRNRLIAALAKGVLVVEAAHQSGSLITAKQALDIGREVFAIPGSIHSPVAKGCHQLLRQGAKLVESGQDIIEELQPMLSSGIRPKIETVSAPSGSIGVDPVLEAMGFDPVQLLDITRRCKLPSHRVQTRLLELELLGQIARLDDGRLLQIVEAT